MAVLAVLVMVAAFAVIVGLAILIGVGLTRRGRAAAMQRRAPRLHSEARVIDKRSEVTGSTSGPARQSYFVTFQFPDGNRLEFGVSGPESGMLAVGDSGVVEWQGTRYLGFAREILR